MNAVGKNLKQLRQREKLTQDALAERLHVTRQAVSSWETGKTQPDIETLTALAEALGADIRELIYGPGRVERLYIRFQRRYIACTAICILAFLAWCVLELTLAPYLAELLKKGYLGWPSYIFACTVPPVVYAAAGVLLPSAISLWGDIRLRSDRVRRVLSALGLLLLGHYVLWAVVPLLGNWYSIFRDWFYLLFRLPLLRNGSLFLAGCLLFLGLNK